MTKRPQLSPAVRSLVGLGCALLACVPAQAQTGRAALCSRSAMMNASLRRQGISTIRRQAGQAPRNTLGTGFLPAVPLRGTVRGLQVLLSFPNDQATANAPAATAAILRHTPDYFQRLLWDATNPFSMASYWRENSFGLFTLTGDTVSLSAFNATSVTPLGDGRGNAAGTTATVTNFADSLLRAGDNGRSAVASIVNQISSTVDFSRYDSDGDGRVDLFIVTYPLLNTAHAALQAVPPTAATYQADLLRARSSYISQPILRSLGQTGAPVAPVQTPNGVVIDSWAFVSEEFCFLGTSANVSTSPQNGVAPYVHQTGHAFGLPDLADEANLSGQASAGAGLFDGMSLGSRNLPDRVGGLASVGFNPLSFLGSVVHTTAWGKNALGWLTPTNVTGTLTNQTLRPIELFADCFKLNVNGDTRASEYFLVENRQNVGNWDVNLVGTRITPTTGPAAPGTGAAQAPIHGLLVWHVNERVIESNILVNQVNVDPIRPGLKLIQADGRDDLLQPLPGLAGIGGGTFDLISFAFTGFTPTGNDGDDSDPFPGTRTMVHVGDGSDGRALLIDNAGLTPTGNLASTLTFQGGLSGVVIDTIREQLPAVPRAAGGNDIVANLVSQTLAQLTTSSLTVISPAANDRLENFTPTMTTIYTTSHPAGAAGNPLTASSISLAISGVVGTTADIDGNGTQDGVPFIQNGVAVSVPGIGLGTLQLAADGTLVFQPPLLSAGAHTITVTALNALGQRVTSAPVTFFLQQRRLRGGLAMLSFPYRFTQPLADATELQPNSPLSAFRFADLAAGGPATLLGVQNPTFGRFDLGRYGEILRGRSGFTSPYHVFTPGRSIVNLDPYIDVAFPGLAYWARIDPLGVLLQLQARSVSTSVNFRVIHEDADAAGTLPVYDLTNGRLTYTTTNGVTVGWRMIGNPFPFPISYNSIVIRFQGQTLTLSQALANSPPLLSSALFRFDSSLAASGGYALDIAPNGTLNPFEGVWINFLQPVQVEISPLRTAANRTLTQPTMTSEADNWKLRLSVRAGGASDVHNYLGLQPEAQDSYDPRDIPKPPDSPGSRLRLSLLSGTGGTGLESRALVRLMQDLRRGPLTTLQKYDFEVDTSLENTEVALSWDDAGRTPGRYRLTFVDVESGRRLYMRTTSGYVYNSGSGGSRLFRIEVEPDTGARMQISSLHSAQTADGRSVRLSYTLTQAATVQAQVVNAAGKIVRRFAPQTGGRGLNSLIWDARDDTGRRLARGLYLIQLVAQTDEQQEGRAVASVTLK